MVSVRNHGKYTKMSKSSPRGIARCDYSGLMVKNADLQRQYQYRGRGLVDTGFLVYKKFIDRPNSQDLTPLIYIDPQPLLPARPDNVVDVITPSLLDLDVSGGADVTLTAQQFNNNNLIFRGLLTADITIFVPATFNDFFVDNITTGGFTLSMQIINNTSTIIEVPNGIQILMCNDSLTLKIINPN